MNSARTASGEQLFDCSFLGDNSTLASFRETTHLRMTREHVAVRRRRHSKAKRIEDWLIPHLAKTPGGPSSFALQATEALGVRVSKQEISRCITQLNMTRKKFSRVPLFSVPAEREAYLSELSALWTSPDQVHALQSSAVSTRPHPTFQMVFVDEKKYRQGDIEGRSEEYAYAVVGKRPDPQYVLLRVRVNFAYVSRQLRPAQRKTDMPKKVCVIGALSIVDPLPMVSGELGDVGLIAMQSQEKNFTAEEILLWFRNTLAPQLTPFPGPRSIVLIDNMPEHRRWDIFPQLRHLITSRGAMLITNPPQSPDLNPIEKFWDVTLATSRRRMFELILGKHGPQRKFNVGDLVYVLQTTRMSLRSYEYLMDK